MNYQQLNHEIGNMDLYLLDQVLKGRFDPSMKVLDAGSGEGRNLMYFIRNNYDVHAVDINASAIQMLQFVARSINPELDKGRFITENAKMLPYEEGHFDCILSSAVLHFAKDHREFKEMVIELARVLKKNGVLFIRMASNIGIEPLVEISENGTAIIPDGSYRYLATRESILWILEENGFSTLEPVKTVNVEDKRCMTTLVLQKNS